MMIQDRSLSLDAARKSRKFSRYCTDYLSEKVRRWSIAAALTLSFAFTGAAEDVSDNERFKLDNGCFPFQLEVAYVSKDAGSLDLSQERIKVVVRSRLRAAQLYTDDNTASFLYVHVNVVSNAFSYRFTFHKLMEEILSISRMSTEREHVYYPATWTASATGTHAQSSEYILATVSEATDHFIDEFLRVNDSTCGKAN